MLMLSWNYKPGGDLTKKDKNVAVVKTQDKYFSMSVLHLADIMMAKDLLRQMISWQAI